MSKRRWYRNDVDVATLFQPNIDVETTSYARWESVCLHITDFAALRTLETYIWTKTPRKVQQQPSTQASIHAPGRAPKA